MELDKYCYRNVHTPATALCSGLQHSTAAAAAAYLHQQLLTYNPATVATTGLPFAAIKQSAPAFTAPLGEQDKQHNEGARSDSLLLHLAHQPHLYQVTDLTVEVTS
jgi:hypothetical protein